MELRQIRYFVTIAESSSISRAAERVHVAQPALSLSLKNLEDELGARLFSRSRRGMELTDTGAAFLEYAYRILQQVSLATESIKDVAENPRGAVSVAMSASMANVLTVPIYTLLREHSPRIELNLEEGLSGNMLRGFEAGWYDILLDFDARERERYHVEALLREDLYLVSRREPGEPAEAEVRLASVADGPLLISLTQHSMGRTVQEYARQQNVQLKTVAGASALHPAIKLVEAGLVNSVLPWSAIYDLVARGRLTARRITEPPLQREVDMIHDSNRPQSSAAIKVMEIIRLAVRQVHEEDRWRGKLLLDPGH